jgi:mycothione reductase
MENPDAPRLQSQHYDLVIIGTGSGNSILTPDFDGWKVAIVERGVFGGTCLNRGCIPTKMFVYAADLAETVRDASRLGVHAHVDHIDWKAIRDRVFGRIDPIAAGGEAYRRGLPNVDVYAEDARFVGPKHIQVGESVITGTHIVLAAGARPFLPDIPGLEDVAYHTSDTIMRLDEVPRRLIVVGGGYIASELAHVFGAFGSAVTIINRSDTLLRHEDDDIRMRFTEIMRQRFELLLSTQLLAARNTNDGIAVDVSVDGEHRSVEGDVLLLATGRVPNSDELDLAAFGYALDHEGYVVVDEFLRTSVEGVWALGDLSNPVQLKHAANADARVVAHNLANPDDLRRAPRAFIPHAVFAYPQIASIGATERELSAAAVPYVSAEKPYGDAAYGWAMEDTTSFVKILAHRDTRLILGAHIIGPQASTLIQQLIQAMRFGQTVDEIARDQWYIHPALTEVIENALLDL